MPLPCLRGKLTHRSGDGLGECLAEACTHVWLVRRDDEDECTSAAKQRTTCGDRSTPSCGFVVSSC